jgi:hypothetical protein
VSARYQTCRGCGRRIVLIPTDAKRKMMPLDVAPNEDGNVIVYQEGDGAWICHVHRADSPDPVGVRMMPHFATCEARNQR